ncbi:MAG: EAL domain-containing protein [Proteobacteria bacterium]|nr:EAL domain-containing protein [Pseudomonadota bacterium]NBX86416.1 EAL domain-containing protein [Pseudomonadota bacterium]
MEKDSALAQLVLFGAPDVLQKATGFLRAGGGAWSTIQPTTVSHVSQITQQAKAAAQNPDSEPVVALIAAQHADETLKNWLDEASKFGNLAVVMLSDAADVTEAAILRGQPVVLAVRDMTPILLNDSLRLALEFQHLKHQQRGMQQHFDLAEARFRDMAELFADWLWEIDSQLRLTFSSTRKRPAQGATKGSLLTASFLPEEKLRIEDDFAELLRSPRPFHDRDYWSADPYGSRICWSVSGVPVQGGNGELLGFRGIARDISNIKASTDQIYYLVNHDALTGVMNRQRCQDELVRTLRSAKREKRSGALLMMDLDRFGYVNQTYGHLVGDKLLIHFAQVLKDNVRSGDLVARLDGDQFAVLLRDVRPEDVENRLERLQSAIASRPMPTEQATVTLSVSGGVAIYPHDSDNADELLAKALDALSLAKQRGPRRFERFDAANTTAKAAGGQMEWVEMLNECLNNHETRLVLYYQPIVPLVGPALKEKAEHYEVLLRLADRDGNMLAPSKFISTAEEFGLVAKIDHLVTTRAIDMLKIWHEQGRQVHLSVNLSGKTFDDKNFLNVIKQYLTEANLPKKALIFEITETALLRDLQLVKKFMTEMREAGAGFALDDCGVGYSSFNYIRQLELDFIKIDGSFIRNLHLNNDDQAFVKALADVARQKNISTVAEMVEHEGAMIALQQLGIDFGQGFFFAPPAAELSVQGWTKKFVN